MSNGESGESVHASQGEARKSDVVAALLAVRACQSSPWIPRAAPGVTCVWLGSVLQGCGRHSGSFQ
eukprot:3226369-Amphidinium_carterae.1